MDVTESLYPVPKDGVVPFLAIAEACVAEAHKMGSLTYTFANGIADAYHTWQVIENAGYKVVKADDA